jgi:hypothetical protein
MAPMSLPASAASRMSTIRPRGESISSPHSTYVGQVGRQKPQWMQAWIRSASMRQRPPT